MNTFEPLWSPVEDVAAVAVKYWPEPTHYQAAVVTCSALMETGARVRSDGSIGPGGHWCCDRRAFYYNDEGELPETWDRSAFAINEDAAVKVIGSPILPSRYTDLDYSGWVVRQIWDWRYNRKMPMGDTVALPYAYSIWTTYRKARVAPIEPVYAQAWKDRWPTAKAAAGYVG